MPMLRRSVVEPVIVALGGQVLRLVRFVFGARELLLVQHVTLPVVAVDPLPLLIWRHLHVLDAARDLRSAQPHAFLFNQVVLLGAQDAARAHDADPPDEVGSRKLEVLHRVDADQRARAPQACLAMDRNGAGLLLRDPQELVDDGVRRRGTVNKEEVCVVDSVAREFGFVVLGLVEADDVVDAKVLEHLDVVLRSVAPLRLPWQRVDGPHERDELVRDDPVEVSVFDFLVILVLLVVKFSEYVPAKANSKLQALEAVENSALIGAGVSVTSIAEGPKLGVVGRKGLPHDLSRLLQHNDHEGAHQKARIRLLVELGAGKVEELDVLVPLVREQTAQFAHVLVG